MAEDEDAPIRKRRWLEPLMLDSLGVEELHAYIEALKGEIVGGEILLVGCAVVQTDQVGVENGPNPDAFAKLKRAWLRG